jgi:hypothetical protein
MSAQLLDVAGQSFSAKHDAVVLPGLDRPRPRSREVVLGATDLGLMINTSDWKLCRYKNGHVALYNLIDDPHEQHNLAYQASALTEMKRMDALLQQSLLESLMINNGDKFVEKSRYQGRGEFGQPGWQRPYPASLAERT